MVQSVRSDPVRWDVATLGRPIEEYLAYISDDSRWGGQVGLIGLTRHSVPRIASECHRLLPVVALIADLRQSLPNMAGGARDLRRESRGRDLRHGRSIRASGRIRLWAGLSKAHLHALQRDPLRRGGRRGSADSAHHRHGARREGGCARRGARHRATSRRRLHGSGDNGAHVRHLRADQILQTRSRRADPTDQIPPRFGVRASAHHGAVDPPTGAPPADRSCTAKRRHAGTLAPLATRTLCSPGAIHSSSRAIHSSSRAAPSDQDGPCARLVLHHGGHSHLNCASLSSGAG